jgi:peptidoglycan/LPS O-acetylase OafA/YrhL
MLSHGSLLSFGSFAGSWFHNYGAIGVDIFFAISGILICSRLLNEEHRHGRISLSGFYIRRSTRIIPPALFYLCVIALLAHLSLIQVGLKEWLGSLFFYRNYTFLIGPGPSEAKWYTGHFWSLSVEEHFYIILPALLILTKKRLRVPVMSLLVVLVATNCAIQLHSRPWTLIEFHSDVRLNSLLIPALFAVLAVNPHLKDRFKTALQFWPFAVVCAVVLLSFSHGAFWQICSFALLMPCIVLGSVLNPNTLLGRFLELRALRYLGRISYSLYLWQQLFFTSHFGPHATLGNLQRWPLCGIMVIMCAVFSYHFIERPMSKIGHRLAATFTTEQSLVG